jgi:hypothetical protein
MEKVFDIERWASLLEAEAHRFISSAPPAGRTLAQEENYLKSIRKLIKRLNEDLEDFSFQLEDEEAVVELDGVFTKEAVDNYRKAAEAIGIAAIGIPS